MNDILSIIRQELIRNSDEKTLQSSKHFFKESIVTYGVTMPVVGRIAKEQYKLAKNLTKTELFELCTQLWESGYLEESFIACNWSYFIHQQYDVSDFKVFEEWVKKYVNNWASCDTLCNHTIGKLLTMYPELLIHLKGWATSSNRWTRRAAAVSLIIPAREGRFLEDIFAIADLLLLDNDDLVQKGYGWMLKAASQAHQQEVFEYVMKNKKVMPRTSLRYAIEKMPPPLKAQAMAK